MRNSLSLSTIATIISVIIVGTALTAAWVAVEYVSFETLIEIMRQAAVGSTFLLLMETIRRILITALR